MVLPASSSASRIVRRRRPASHAAPSAPASRAAPGHLLPPLPLVAGPPCAAPAAPLTPTYARMRCRRPLLHVLAFAITCYRLCLPTPLRRPQPAARRSPCTAVRSSQEFTGEEVLFDFPSIPLFNISIRLSQHSSFPVPTIILCSFNKSNIFETSNVETVQLKCCACVT